MRNKLITCAIVLLLIFGTNICMAKTFNDLLNTHWAFETVNKMSEKGIVNGYPDGSFKPDNSITRAEFSKILVLSLGLKNNTLKTFSDVPNTHWAYNYIGIAGNYFFEFINNETQNFRPNEECVREEVAAAIVIANGFENTKYDLDILTQFEDSYLISSDLKKYVAIAVERKLMVGNGNGTFNPKGKLTRAEVAQLMLNTEKYDNGTGSSKGSPTLSYFDDDEPDNSYVSAQYNETIIKMVYKNGSVTLKDINENDCSKMFIGGISVDDNGKITFNNFIAGENIKSVSLQKIVSESETNNIIVTNSLSPLTFEILDNNLNKVSDKNSVNITYLIRLVY